MSTVSTSHPIGRPVHKPNPSEYFGLRGTLDRHSIGGAGIHQACDGAEISLKDSHSEGLSGAIDRAVDRARDWGKRKRKRKSRGDKGVPPNRTERNPNDGTRGNGSKSSGSGSGSGELTYSMSRCCSSADEWANRRSPILSSSSNSPPDRPPILGMIRPRPRLSRAIATSANVSSDEGSNSGWNPSGNRSPKWSLANLRLERSQFSDGQDSPIRPTASSSDGASPLSGTSPTTQSSSLSSFQEASSAPCMSIEDATRSSLSKKYGSWGKVLKSSTEGTVCLVNGKSKGSGAMYAVKQFRKREQGESQQEYYNKVTAAFRFGSVLKHINVIETIEILNDQGRFYQVMEYVPGDLFIVATSGQMSRPEIDCVFRQIIEGVSYLHGIGLAHRDLKLENCLMTKGNVVKIIDFGSATIFHLPGEPLIKARGTVGSEPYMPPEVFFSRLYDPQKADVWSIAIIFFCMTLRRFVWMAADKTTDRNFRSFVHLHPELSSGSTSDSDSSLLQLRRFLNTHLTERPDSTSKSLPSTSGSLAARALPGDTNKTSKSEAESIFKLLPRETRTVLKRMMHIDPDARCTLADLLVGTRKFGRVGIVSSSGDHSPSAMDATGGEPTEENDDGDDWLNNIAYCSLPWATPDHTHVDVC